MKKCPYCAEDIQNAAVVCRYCGRDIGPASRPSTVANSPKVDFQAWLDKGRALIESERYQEALEAFDRAIRLNPKGFGAWLDTSKALTELERYREALKAADRAIELLHEHNNTGAPLPPYGEDRITTVKEALAIAALAKAAVLKNLGREEEAGALAAMFLFVGLAEATGRDQDMDLRQAINMAANPRQAMDELQRQARRNRIKTAIKVVFWVLPGVLSSLQTKDR